MTFYGGASRHRQSIEEASVVLADSYELAEEVVDYVITDEDIEQSLREVKTRAEARQPRKAEPDLRDHHDSVPQQPGTGTEIIGAEWAGIRVGSAKIAVLGTLDSPLDPLVHSLPRAQPFTVKTVTRLQESPAFTLDAEGPDIAQVAMECGRLTLDDDLLLYIFQGPSHARYSAMWPEITHSTLGTVALVDCARPSESLKVIRYLEDTGIPYMVGAQNSPSNPADLRRTLPIGPDIRVMPWNGSARSARSLLLSVVRYSLRVHGYEIISRRGDYGPIDRTRSSHRFVFATAVPA